MFIKGGSAEQSFCFFLVGGTKKERFMSRPYNLCLSVTLYPGVQTPAWMPNNRV